MGTYPKQYLKKKYDISKEEIKELLTDGTGVPLASDEIRQTGEALIGFANAYAAQPPAGLKNKILGKLAALHAQKEKQVRFALDNLPPLEPTSNWLEWDTAVRHIEPPSDFENIHLHPLESNEKRELFVAWVKEYVEEEVHYDLLESFLILEGSCECHITNGKGDARVVKLTQGDFITMQLGEVHDIVITSFKPAKAILEWRKVAA